MNKNIYLDIYIINIHSFRPKPTCDLQRHSEKMKDKIKIG